MTSVGLSSSGPSPFGQHDCASALEKEERRRKKALIIRVGFALGSKTKETVGTRAVLLVEVCSFDPRSCILASVQGKVDGSWMVTLVVPSLSHVFKAILIMRRFTM